MVNIHVAYSQAINPPSATPVLTRSQIWKGLQRKVRSATEFVPVIVSCKVVSEEGNVVTRDVGFKEGYGQPKVREVCKEYAPTKVDFYQERDGSVISNIVSDGPEGTEQDLQMTYVFEWKHPDIEAGSSEEQEWKKKHQEMAKGAVNSTIESIRKMVKAGEL